MCASGVQDSRKDEVLKAVTRTLEDGRGGTPVRFDLKLSEMSFNIMTRMMFTKVYYGQKMYKSDKEGQESNDFHRLMATVTSVSTFGIGDCFPFLRRFDFDGYEKQMRGLRFQFDSFLDNVIAEHRGQSADTRKERMDFVDVLLQLQSDKNNEAHGVSDEVVKALLIVSFRRTHHMHDLSMKTLNQKTSESVLQDSNLLDLRWCSWSDCKLFP